MDIALTQAVNNLSGRVFIIDQLMIGITSFGIFALVAAVGAMWWRPIDRLAMRHACIVAGLSFLASLAFNQLLLLFIHRMRPYDAGITHLLISANPDWSFPSDHATAASAIVASLWFKDQRREATILAMLAALICFSRIYVGVHYFSDIFGGIAIGAITAFAASKIYDEQNRIAVIATKVF